MIKGIGHIGIAVDNLEESLTVMARALDVDLPSIKVVSEKKMKVALIEMGGIGLELIEDYSEDGPFARFVKEKGNSIHHFCLLTDDIEADIADLETRGIEMADQRSRVGLRGKRIAFTKPSALNGIPFELSEP